MNFWMLHIFRIVPMLPINFVSNRHINASSFKYNDQILNRMLLLGHLLLRITPSSLIDISWFVSAYRLASSLTLVNSKNISVKLIEGIVEHLVVCIFTDVFNQFALLSTNIAYNNAWFLLWSIWGIAQLFVCGRGLIMDSCTNGSELVGRFLEELRWLSCYWGLFKGSTISLEYFSLMFSWFLVKFKMKSISFGSLWLSIWTLQTSFDMHSLPDS